MIDELYRTIELHLRKHDETGDDFHLMMVSTCIQVMLKQQKNNF